MQTMPCILRDSVEAMATKEAEDLEVVRVPKRPKIDAIVSECYISSSQEEILSYIPGWVVEETDTEQSMRTQPAHFENPDRPFSQEADETCSEDSAHGTFHMIGVKPTILCSPPETDNPGDEELGQAWEEFQEEYKPRNLGMDSFDLNFESDRDQSPATQSQTMLRCLGFDLNAVTTETATPQENPSQLKEASSANTKGLRVLNTLKRSTPLNHIKTTPKPHSSRRLLIDPDKRCQDETAPAESPPLLSTDKPTQIPQLVRQLRVTADVGQIDHRLPSTSTTKLAEGQAGANEEAECRRAQRILPYSLAATSVQRDTPTVCLEEEKEIDPSKFKANVPKRRRNDSKPFPKTLMDVIMYYSGDPPIGAEDIDIIEVAIKAGMTFPPPISRNCFLN
eukprot:Gb_11254 [translate_table: standard]